jgi:DNA-binding transcriptional LysR family regulator
MALERRLGTRLLNRSSRRLSLTDDGAAYLQQLRPLLDGIDDLETSVRQTARAPHGLLRISAPVWFANPEFVRLIAGYRRRYPEVQLDIDLSGRFVNLVEHGIDLALRVTAEPAPLLIARPIAQIDFVPVAAPSCFPGGVKPGTVGEMARLPLLWYSILPLPMSLPGPDQTGREAFTPEAPILLSNNESLLHEAALQGMGMAFLPRWLIAEDLAAGRLESVLPDFPPQVFPLFGVYASRRHLSAKLRSFLDYLIEYGRFGAAGR